jgi:hypothetical protein
MDDDGMESRGAPAKKDKRDNREESPFTAILGYGSERLTFDMGRCVLRRVR